MNIKRQIFLFILLCFNSYIVCSAQQTFIQVRGEVTIPLTLYATDLAKMKRVEVKFKDRDEKVYHYSGVPVYEILKQAGAGIGKELRGENLNKYLIVKAADGYKVIFSLAELDSGFTDKVVIMADMMEGKPLPADIGPFRIIIPEEKKHARCIYKVTEMTVRYAKE